MLHPDYQYTPRLVTAMAAMIASGDVRRGARLAHPRRRRARRRHAALQVRRQPRPDRGREPAPGQKLSEYHTGYRAFRREVLESLPLGDNSDDFVFDNEILAQAFAARFRVGELSCPTKLLSPRRRRSTSRPRYATASACCARRSPASWPGPDSSAQASCPAAGRRVGRTAAGELRGRPGARRAPGRTCVDERRRRCRRGGRRAGRARGGDRGARPRTLGAAGRSPAAADRQGLRRRADAGRGAGTRSARGARCRNARCRSGGSATFRMASWPRPTFPARCRAAPAAASGGPSSTPPWSSAPPRSGSSSSGGAVSNPLGPGKCALRRPAGPAASWSAPTGCARGSAARRVSRLPEGDRRRRMGSQGALRRTPPPAPRAGIGWNGNGSRSSSAPPPRRTSRRSPPTRSASRSSGAAAKVGFDELLTTRFPPGSPSGSPEAAALGRDHGAGPFRQRTRGAVAGGGGSRWSATPRVTSMR